MCWLCHQIRFNTSYGGVAVGVINSCVMFIGSHQIQLASYGKHDCCVP